MRESRIRLLVLHADYTAQLSYYDDWRDALKDHPGFDTIAVDIMSRDAGGRIRRALPDVDAVVLLHSTNADTTAHLEAHGSLLADRRVPLLAFVGNEVNLPGSPIAEKRRVLGTIRPDWVATQLLQEAGSYLFADVAARAVVCIPHALNPRVFQPVTPPDDRPIDIGARTFQYLPHLGDDDRNRLNDAFIRLGREGRLRVDISHARFDRAGWAGFLNRCRGTVSTEAGSWYLERDDATVSAIRAYVRRQTQGGIFISNDSALVKVARNLPRFVRAALRPLLKSRSLQQEWKVNEQVPFDDIHRRFFAGRPRAPVYGKCISSRHFDAIGTKTCQIMIRGRFNDVLAPDRHYLALDPDLGNLDSVLERFGDPAERRAVVEAAYAHVREGHTYAHRMQQIAALLSASTGEPLHERADAGRGNHA